MMDMFSFKINKISIALIGLFVLSACNDNSTPVSDGLKQTGIPHLTKQAQTSQQMRQILDSYQNDANSLDKSKFGQVNDSMASSKQAMERMYLDKIDSIDSNKLNDEDKVYYQIFKYDRNIAIQGLSFPNQLFGSYDVPITHFSNDIEYYAKWAGRTRTSTKDYQDQLQIIRYYTSWITNLQSEYQQGYSENIQLPKVLIKHLLKSLNEGVKDNDYQVLRYGLTDIQLNPNKFNNHDNFIVEYSKAVDDAVSATDSLINYLDSQEFYGHARGKGNIQDENIGWGALPNGQAWYQWHLDRNSTTGKSADELHQLGTELVADAKKEMQRVAKFIAKKEGNRITAKWRSPEGQITERTFNIINSKGDVDLKEFFAYLNSEKFFYGRDGKTIISPNEYETICSAASKSLVCQTALIDYNKFKNDANQVVKNYFNPIKTEYTIIPIPAGREKYAGVASYGDNHFNLNTNPYNSLQKWSVSTLLLHEAAPGHHFQHAYSVEYPPKNKPDYINNASYTSYAEGWALYTEWLGIEMGIYGKLDENGKPTFEDGLGMCKENMDYPTFQGGIYQDAEECNALQYFGSLNEAQLRNMRLAVDTGIHSKGWSIADARKYMKQNSALGDGDIESESFRYTAYVGQAVSYKSGFLVIKELLNKAKSELGDNFDWADFHDQILKYGDQPMTVLKDNIELWISTKN